MSLPLFKTLTTIVQEMINYVISNSELSDINEGSVIRSILESAGIQDAEQYVQLQNVLDSFSFESAEGTDLDRRVDDYDLERIPALKATGNIVVTDTSVTTEFKATLSGLHSSGSGTVTSVEDLDALSFPASGTIILERETGLRESVVYTSRTTFVFTLSGTTANTHASGTSIILSQQGSDSTIPLGTIVFVPETSVTPRIDFQTTAVGTLFDGDITTAPIPVEALKVGVDGKVAANQIVAFDTLPFSTATVNNPLSMAVGRDRETAIELATRVKGFIKSLSRATAAAIEFAVIGTTDPIQGEVVTAKVVDRPGSPGITDLFVDNGDGLSATTTTVADELIVENGEAGQKRSRLQFFPGVSPTDLRLFKSVANGTTTAVGVGSLTDSSASYTPAFFVDYIMTDGAGQFFKILANTATVFTLDTPLTPSAGRYAILAKRDGSVGGSPLASPADYAINTTTMEFELVVALAAGERLAAMEDPGVLPGYTRFTGLIEQVQKVASGDPTDIVNFPGVAAAGVHVFTSVPTVINQSFQISIEANIGVSEDDLVQDTKNACLNYVNSLGIGDDIVLSEIIAAVQAISGIFDVKILIPSDNITVGEAEIARTALADITVI